MSFDLTERFLLDRIEQLTQRGAELTAQRDAALAELAALKKRIADAPRRFTDDGAGYYVALVRLTEEDA
jgi:hypothetical protein